MSNEMPEWRKAWKTEDPEWVKQRQKDWKLIRKSPVFEFRFNKDDLTRVKNFFMTGSAFVPEPEKSEWKWMSYDPDTKPLPVTCAPLIECWLGVDGDIERWKQVRANSSADRLSSSRNMFRQTMHKYDPKKGTLFNGRDKMLYNFFVPTRCRPEDYPERDEKVFFHVASTVCYMLRPSVVAFLKESYDESNIAEDALPEWCDSVLPSFHNYKRNDDKAEFCRNVNDVLTAAFSIMERKENYMKPQVDAANYIVDRFNAMDFPSGMKKIAALLKAKA
jgi:hypothetical protein